MSRFDGSCAVVLGVGSRAGAAVARRLAAEGARLVVVDERAETAERVAAECGGRALVGGMADPDAAASVAGDCTRVDVLAYCWAAMETWPQDQDSPARTAQVVAANVVGPMVWTAAFEPLLTAAPAGAVVALGSIDGILGNPQVPGYSAGKAGLAAWTRLSAARLAGTGVRVNCVAAAGLVPTAADAPLDRATGSWELALRLTPLGRVPDPAEIAAVVAFLASVDASYVTGVVLPVDGGRTAATPGTW